MKLQKMMFHPWSLQSISDDDLCADCAHCDYNPGDLSGCDQGWPGLMDENGYVQECESFEEFPFTP